MIVFIDETLLKHLLEYHVVAGDNEKEV